MRFSSGGYSASGSFANRLKLYSYSQSYYIFLFPLAYHAVFPWRF